MIRRPSSMILYLSILLLNRSWADSTILTLLMDFLNLISVSSLFEILVLTIVTGNVFFAITVQERPLFFEILKVWFAERLRRKDSFSIATLSAYLPLEIT